MEGRSKHKKEVCTVSQKNETCPGQSGRYNFQCQGERNEIPANDSPSQSKAEANTKVFVPQNSKVIYYLNEIPILMIFEQKCDKKIYCIFNNNKKSLPGLCLESPGLYRRKEFILIILLVQTRIGTYSVSPIPYHRNMSSVLQPYLFKPFQ